MQKIINFLKLHYIPLTLLSFGILFRVIMLDYMEYKYDERWMFEETHKMVEANVPLPILGMESGGHIKNPGLSLWPFVLIAHVTETAVGMDAWVVFFNLVALLLFYFFFKKIEKNETKKILTVGTLLFAISPLPVFFARKIWAQDLLPILSVLILIGHHYRDRFSGAFVWGLVGAIIGQVHMSGFFYAFAFFLGTIWIDLQKWDNRKSHWIGWFSGSIIGALPLIPWAIYIFSEPRLGETTHLGNLLKFRFFTYIPMNAFGVHIKYLLEKSYVDYLTSFFYLPLLIQLLLWISLIISPYFIYKKIKSGQANLKKDKPLTQYALIFAIMSIVYTLVAVKIYPHYLIIIAPFAQVLLVWTFFEYKKILHTIFLLQLLTTLTLFLYIRFDPDLSKGIYGIPFKFQTFEKSLHEVYP